MLSINLKGHQLHQQSNEAQPNNHFHTLPLSSEKRLNIDLNKNDHQVQEIFRRMYYPYSPDDFNLHHSHRALSNILDNNAHMRPQELLRFVCFQYPNKQNKQYFNLYLPTFLRLEIIRFSDLVVTTHKGSFYGLIHYDIDVTNLPNSVVDYIKEHCIWRLFFEENRTWKINKSNAKLQRQKVEKIDDRTLLRCRFYSVFQTRVLTNIEWAPNQTARMLLSIKAQKLMIPKSDTDQYKKMMSEIISHSQQKMKHFQEKGFSIRFCMMDYMYELERQPGKYNVVNEEGNQKKQPLVKDMAQVMYGPYLQFGPYKLAQREIKFEYSYKQQNTFEKIQTKKLRYELNQSWWVKFLQSKTPKIKENKPQRDTEPNFSVQNPVGKRFEGKNYCHSICNAHFMIPLSRKPLSPFIKLFLPPYLFALLALMLFWQPLGVLGLPARESALIFLFVALFTRLGIFNQQIHNLPKLSYIQKIQYILTMIPVIAGFHTYVGAVRDDYKFQWYTDPFFLIALFLLFIATSFCIIFLVRYYFFRIRKQSIAHGLKIDLKISQWVTPACYPQFAEVKEKRIHEAYSY